MIPPSCPLHPSDTGTCCNNMRTRNSLETGNIGFQGSQRKLISTHSSYGFPIVLFFIIFTSFFVCDSCWGCHHFSPVPPSQTRASRGWVERIHQHKYLMGRAEDWEQVYHVILLIWQHVFFYDIVFSLSQSLRNTQEPLILQAWTLPSVPTRPTHVEACCAKRRL